MRLLCARDPGLEVRAVDGAADIPTDSAQPVYVVVSVAEGVHVPERWAADLTRALTTSKPGGAPADEVYVVTPRPR
jgi:hypothetical protein